MPHECGLTAPVPTPDPDEPNSTPIRLRDLDTDLAKRVLERPSRLAASILPGIAPARAKRLADAAIDLIVSRAARGDKSRISITEIAAHSGVSRAEIEGSYRSLLPAYANLTCRAVNAQAPRRVFYEEINSHRSRAGRRYNGVGTEKDAAGHNGLHLLEHSLGTSNSHCPLASLELTMGTRWDRSSRRFGSDLPEWTKSYHGRIPDTFAEHLKLMLDADWRVRSAVTSALGERRGDFDAHLTAENLLAAFSKFVVVPPIPFGRPEVPYRDHLDIFFPGRDPATVKVAVASDRYVVLACGEPDTQARTEFEAAAEPCRAGELPAMYSLDIHKDHEVEYRWSPSRQELGRYQAGPDPAIEIWRFVNYDSEDPFWQMLSLVERQVQVFWPRDCTERWEADCRPAMLSTHLPESCAAVRALLAIANAGIVDALRRQVQPPGRPFTASSA